MHVGSCARPGLDAQLIRIGDQGGAVFGFKFRGAICHADNALRCASPVAALGAYTRLQAAALRTARADGYQEEYVFSNDEGQ
jgi:hypothetical protein